MAEAGDRELAALAAVRTADVSKWIGGQGANLEPIQSSSQTSAARQANRENNVAPEIEPCGCSAVQSASRFTSR